MTIVWLFALSLAWPLDVYQTVPGIRLPLSVFLAVCLVFAAFWGDKGLLRRIPIELWWPAPLLMVAAWLAVSQGGASILVAEALLAILLFLSVAGAVRNRHLVEWALLLSAMSGSVLALINFAAIEAGIPPTAYVLETGVTMAGPATVSGGIFQNGLLGIIAVGLAFRSSFGPLHRTAATFAAVPLIGSFAGKTWQSAEHAYDWGNSMWAAQPAAYLMGMGVLVWLMARIAGKIAADAGNSKSGLHAHFLVVLLSTVIFIAVVPIEIRAYHGLLLGLAAAYVLPARDDKPFYMLSPGWYAGPAILLLLLALNLPGVTPRSSLDNRDFAADAEQDLASGAYHRLRWRMENLYTLYPTESSRLGMWQARASVGLSEYERGSLEYAWAVRENSDAVVVPPKQDKILMQYRDLSSAADSRSLHFERVVAASQGLDAVMSIMSLKSEAYSSSEESGIPFALQHAAVAFLLSLPDIESELNQAQTQAISAAMGCAEISMENFSVENTFPTDWLMVGYLRTPAGPQVVAMSPDHKADSQLPVDDEWRIRPERRSRENVELTLDDDYRLEEEGQQAVAVIHGEGADGVPLAYVYSNEDGSLAINWNTELDTRDFPYTARVMVLERR